MADQKASVGRIVHFQAHGSADGKYPSVPRAAVVTEVEADGTTVGVCVLNPTGFWFNRNSPFSETPKAGCWSWPPRI